MRIRLVLSGVISAVVMTAIGAEASTSYVGHSGAPGRLICSISCHHRHNFEPTMTVTGFPESYIPGQEYTISVTHNGGSSIRNFNCSIRIGNDTVNAGVIASGFRTATYSTRGETNGVHFSSYSIDSANFLWTAPPAGTGEVRLYWAGLQGILTNGADTQLVLISSENITSIDDNSELPKTISLSQNYPNPFNTETTIRFSLICPEIVNFSIYDIMGRDVYAKEINFDKPGDFSIRWDGRDWRGFVMPSGIYFYRLRTSSAMSTRKMILLK